MESFLWVLSPALWDFGRRNTGGSLGPRSQSCILHPKAAGMRGLEYKIGRGFGATEALLLRFAVAFLAVESSCAVRTMDYYDGFA